MGNYEDTGMCAIAPAILFLSCHIGTKPLKRGL
jgi:hypothetical protein